MKASYQQYVLQFERPSGTSRGILKTKETWFLILKDQQHIGIGECGLLRGLSADDRPDYEQKLQWVCDHIHWGLERLYSELQEFPSIQFGLEMVFASLQAADAMCLYPSAFTQGEAGIPINGLIWMGEPAYMKEQIAQKIAAGFDCIKMKIGAIDFEIEFELLAQIRKEFSANDIELRVDANGAFSPDQALEKLERLAGLHLHSIEQPIAVKQWDAMAELCQKTPLAIALDEELIGISDPKLRAQVLDHIKPQFVILKPSFIGGFRGSDSWIHLAESRGIGWWITSALESNVGLNAISQYTFTKNSILPQGLGTGGLFTNNIHAPLGITDGTLMYNSQKNWDLSPLRVT